MIRVTKVLEKCSARGNKVGVHIVLNRKGWRWTSEEVNTLSASIRGTHGPTQDDFMPPCPFRLPAAQHNVIYG